MLKRCQRGLMKRPQRGLMTRGPVYLPVLLKCFVLCFLDCFHNLTVSKLQKSAQILELCASNLLQNLQ